MIEYRAYIVHKSINEIIPRRALDRANATGQWFKFIVPIMPRKRYGYPTERAALSAIDRHARKLGHRADEFRALVWLAGRENEAAATYAI